jgi:two-component system heavy metal sensor histidine kinase CusS
MSLRGRFVAASSIVALATLSSAFSAVWLFYNAAQERQLDAALLEEAQENALDEARSEDPSGDHRLALRHEGVGPNGKYAVIYDADGQPIRYTLNLESARPRMDLVRHTFGAPFDLWWNNEHLRATWVPIARDHRQSLLLATPRTDLDGDATYLARGMAAAVLIAVAASAAATSWLARALTRDHERIAEVARRVAGGDLSARIAIRSGDPEMAQLGRDVDEMIARLAVLVESQQRFIASASHELRSPITTMLGELSFALRRPRDAATYRASIEDALASARQLKAVTEDLLALARIGAAHPELETVLLSEATEAALQASRAAAETAGVTLETSCDGAAVQGHPGDLQRLVRNLVENAIRHSPPGGRVRIEAHQDATDARLVVSDEGPGVPSEVRERIFEPFFRLPADRPADGGAGLGLAIGRSIARAHGGDLWVDPTAPDARGARFVVRLPVHGPGAHNVDG